MPNFNNRENKRIELPDGNIFFHSRSTAVVICVVCIVNNEPHVLMVERGEKVDNSGLWCMPCGYLDWDEDLYAAASRELFEETGLDIVALEQQAVHLDKQMPYYIESSPKAHRQNISHHFGVAFHGSLPALPKTPAMDSGEIVQAEWVRMSAIQSDKEIEESGVKNMYAFHHNERALRFLRLLEEKGLVPAKVH